MIPHPKVPVANDDGTLNPQWRRFFERVELGNDSITYRLPGGNMTFTGQADGTVTQVWEPR